MINELCEIVYEKNRLRSELSKKERVSSSHREHPAQHNSRIKVVLVMYLLNSTNGKLKSIYTSYGQQLFNIVTIRLAKMI